MAFPWKSALRLVAVVLGIAATFTSTAMAQQESSAIRIGWLPDPNVGFYLAREKMLFEKAGLRPEYVKFLSGPAMFSALQSGSVDVAEVGLAPAIIARSQGIDIKIISVSADTSTTDALVTQPDFPIKNPSDMKGKRIASVKGTAPYFGLVRYLNSGGLSLKDIQFYDLSAQNIVPAFRRKEIDAAWIWSPWQNMIVEAGGKRVMSTLESGLYVPCVWVVRTEWLKSNPSALQKFLKAFDGGLRQVRLDKEAASKQLSETLNVDRKVAAEIAQTARYPDLATQYGTDDPLSLVGTRDGGGMKPAIEKIAELLVSGGIIAKAIGVDTLLDKEPVASYVRDAK